MSNSADLPINFMIGAGCEGISVVDNELVGFNWEPLFLYLGIVGIFYGMIVMISPFKLFPTDGKMKYLWMGFEAGIKENEDGRGEYDSFTTGMMHFSGLLFAGKGLIYLWAANVHPDLTFFTCLAITFGLGTIIFLKVIFVDGGFDIKKAGFWGAAFLAQFIACLWVNIVDVGDKDQFNRADVNHKSTGKTYILLYFLAIFNMVGSLTLFMGSFEKFEALLGAPFYMKEEGYAYNAFSRTVQRLNACLNFGTAVVLLCAATIANSSVLEGHKFPFPLAFFVDWMCFIVWIMLCMVGNPGYWEEFAIFQSTLIAVGAATALLIGWQVDCY